MVKEYIIKTKMLRRYLIKFIIRLFIFCFIFTVYIKNKQIIILLMTYNVSGITPLNILWGAFMIMMILHLIPNRSLSMALNKYKDANYIENEGFSEIKLYKFVHEQNIRAWNVMLIWLFFNAIWGILYLIDVFDSADLLMITVFYFLCDYICILFFCPFQTYIMKNKCCVNCRIYDWGHFMMFTPMLFIKNFFSWSLFFMSLVVLIHWEIIYAKYPERFWSGSNKTLQCVNCKDKICQLKIK